MLSLEWLVKDIYLDIKVKKLSLRLFFKLSQTAKLLLKG